MSKTQRPIRILLYEDKRDYAASFKTFAQRARIITDHVDNADDLLEKLNTSPKSYQFIVLDARAYMHEGQQEGTEDEMNLITVVQELDKLKYRKKINIPYCINTGFADLKLRLSGKVDCKIFEKGAETEVFEYIWCTYRSSDKAKLTVGHPEIFEFATDHFSDTEFDVLSELFLNNRFNNSEIPERVNNLNTLRRTLEHLLDVIFTKYLKNQSGIITHESRRLGEISKHLNDNGEMPVHVFCAITSIRKIAGAFGSHTSTKGDNANMLPSSELIAGLAFSLKDIFSWASSKI